MGAAMPAQLNSGPRFTRTCFGVLALTLVVGVGALQVPAVSAEATSGAQSVSGAFATNEGTTIRVNFSPGTISVRDARVVARVGDAGSTKSSDAAMVSQVVELVGELASSARSLFPQPEETLRTWQTAPLAPGEPPLADLTQYVELTPVPGLSPEDMVDKVKAMPGVLEAYLTPHVRSQGITSDETRSLSAGLATVSPQSAAGVGQEKTPLFESKQGYRLPGVGMDVLHVNALPGGDGQGIRIHGIERGWVRDHEDLATLARPEALVAQGKPTFGDEMHGTAAMGEVVATKDDKGVTGIAYAAEGQMTNTNFDRFGASIPGAITTALTKLRAGDVMFTVVGVSGCDLTKPGGPDTVAEYEPATYDAVRVAIAQGVHVVQSAGNGRQNFDHPCYQAVLPPKKADSGSIYVAAGGAGEASGEKCQAARTPMSFTNYGNRINVQGWGECVVTAGYGGLHGEFGFGGDLKVKYTATFGGTSSAGPMVAGAVATLSGLAKAQGKTVTPAQMRELLVRTGQPQPAGSPTRIGPLPDLKRAAAELPQVWSDPAIDN